MLDFARTTLPSRGSADLNVLVRDAVERLLVPETIRVEQSLSEGQHPLGGRPDGDQRRGYRSRDRIRVESSPGGGARFTVELAGAPQA